MPTDSEEEAFRDIDVGFLVGSMPRREGMLRKDLLTANAKIFRSQGLSLDKFAKKTVKVRERCVVSHNGGRPRVFFTSYSHVIFVPSEITLDGVVKL